MGLFDFVRDAGKMIGLGGDEPDPEAANQAVADGLVEQVHRKVIERSSTFRRKPGSSAWKSRFGLKGMRFSAAVSTIGWCRGRPS